MPLTGRLGTAVSICHCQSLPFLFLGELSGFGNITMPLTTITGEDFSSSGP